MHLTKWAVALAIFWLLLSGFLKPLLFAFGAISVALVLYVLKRMDDVDSAPQQLGANFSLLRYLPWLMGQIVASSVQVTQLIWGSVDKVSPAIAKVDSSTVSKSNRVTYANSITLTPGTLSVDLDDEHITVHALQSDSIEELAEGGMAKKIESLWGEKHV